MTICMDYGCSAPAFIYQPDVVVLTLDKMLRFCGAESGSSATWFVKGTPCEVRTPGNLMVSRAHARVQGAKIPKCLIRCRRGRHDVRQIEPTTALTSRYRWVFGTRSFFLK